MRVTRKAVRLRICSRGTSLDLGLDELVEQDEVALAGRARAAATARQRAGNGDDAEDFGRVAGLELALVAQQQSEAEGLVEDAGEGVRGVEGDRGEERIDLLLEELDCELALGLAELVPRQDARCWRASSSGTRRSFQQAS